jgi:hypothetical protein
MGHFSSASQHWADPAYDAVKATIVRIKPGRTDALWL